MQKIEEIVGEVLDAMRRRGLREYTLKHENWSIYRPIINWHHKNGTEYYSEELLEGLCKHQQTRYENGRNPTEILPFFYNGSVPHTLLCGFRYG